MSTTDIDRRQLLQSGAIAAAMAASGRLPLLMADQKGGSGIDPATSAYSVKPILTYLKRFSSCRGNLIDNGNYTLSYDIIHWAGSTTQTPTPANPVIGKLKVAREILRTIGFDSTVGYNIRQTTMIGGVDNVIAAQVTCERGKPDSIAQWQFSRYSTTPGGDVDAISRLHERGRIRKGRIEVENSKSKYTFECSRDVAAQWTILDILADRPNTDLDIRFDLLQDLSLFKPDQHLTCDGDVDIEIDAGRKVTLTSYCQTGSGILPIHYLCDSRGLPQLVTHAMVSWALTDCTVA